MNVINSKMLMHLFPDAVTDVVTEDGGYEQFIDLDKIKKAFGLEQDKESYEFKWVGKNLAKIAAFTSINKKFIPCKERSVNWENTQNLYIEGDNLDALKLLQEDYSGKIRMIYIDPPYNTGKNFTYNDNFLEKSAVFKNKLLNEVNKNTVYSARVDSSWCSMIYPRLSLAKTLLSEDGVIFISIDDNEVSALRMICDEIFGKSAYITTFIWEKTQHFGRQKLNSYSNADYILCYAKSNNENKIKELLVERRKDNLSDAPLYNALNNKQDITFPKGTVKFNLKDGFYNHSSSTRYELKTPVQVLNGYNQNAFTLSYKSRWSEQTIKEEIQRGTTFCVKTLSFAIRAVYSKSRTTNIAPKQIIFSNSKNPYYTRSRFDMRVSTSETASKELKELLDECIFSYPKPVSLIMYLCSLLYNSDKNEFEDDFTVLDFFGGSSTTAEAVMRLNAIDGGKRKFIIIQIPEKIKNSDKYKNICELGEDRIKKAGKNLKSKFGKKLSDIGFKVYKIQ